MADYNAQADARSGPARSCTALRLRIEVTWSLPILSRQRAGTNRCDALQLPGGGFGAGGVRGVAHGIFAKPKKFSRFVAQPPEGTSGLPVIWGYYRPLRVWYSIATVWSLNVGDTRT